MAVLLLFCEVLSYGVVQYCSKHSCVIAENIFSICLGSVHVVNPYSSFDTTAARSKLCHILSLISYLHMADRLPITVIAFDRRV